jgi:carboxymethylenebutenolidase
MEKEIRIETPSGSMRTFIAHPDGDGPFPVGVIFMDAIGYRETLRDIGRRYAENGYFVVVPDLFHGFGDGIVFDLNAIRAVGMDSPEGRRLMSFVTGLTTAMGATFTQAILDHLPGEPAADDELRTCLGFCMGSRHAVHTLAAFPDRFSAAAGIHPGKLVTDAADSSHLEFADIRGELYLGFAQRDDASSPEQLAALEEAARAHDVKLRIEVYPDTDHGFAMADTAVFDEAGRERHFERTLELWGGQRSAAGQTIR